MLGGKTKNQTRMNLVESNQQLNNTEKQNELPLLEQ
jgi:hypothetical protein